MIACDFKPNQACLSTLCLFSFFFFLFFFKHNQGCLSEDRESTWTLHCASPSPAPFYCGSGGFQPRKYYNARRSCYWKMFFKNESLISPCLSDSDQIGSCGVWSKFAFEFELWHFFLLLDEFATSVSTSSQITHWLSAAHVHSLLP